MWAYFSNEFLLRKKTHQGQPAWKPWQAADDALRAQRGVQVRRCRFQPLSSKGLGEGMGWGGGGGDRGWTRVQHLGPSEQSCSKEAWDTNPSPLELWSSHQFATYAIGIKLLAVWNFSDFFPGFWPFIAKVFLRRCRGVLIAQRSFSALQHVYFIWCFFRQVWNDIKGLII